MIARLKFVQSVWHDILVFGGVEKVLFPNLRVVDTKPDFVRAEMKVLPMHLNRLQTVHGGVVASLIDIGGSLAVASRGKFMTGVSTDLSTTFISAVGKPGDELRLDCFVDKVGRNLAFTRVDIYRLTGEEPKLVARGNHTKFVASSANHERDIKTSWDTQK